jgi:HAE1 family hydrophobic/amphiphilic exporter-1
LRAPLAVAVIGGLISATALTLIVVPVAYDLIEEGRVRLRMVMGLREVDGPPARLTARPPGGVGQGGD